jgi:hypothetical protein
MRYANKVNIFSSYTTFSCNRMAALVGVKHLVLSAITLVTESNFKQLYWLVGTRFLRLIFANSCNHPTPSLFCPFQTYIQYPSAHSCENLNIQFSVSQNHRGIAYEEPSAKMKFAESGEFGISKLITIVGFCLGIVRIRLSVAYKFNANADRVFCISYFI